ncbi:phasin family protein [Ramlibacter sp. MMS24-I3-19]|uniref:phasin family protein n=1 Tax=Ramlibacter sp. MMS24-I3-19 TaxID=3416606 RepID=UPI003D08A149
MSTRKPSATAGPSPAGADLAAWNDLPRQQLAACTQACCAMFRGFEAVRRVQQKTAHQALAHHQAIAEKLNEPCHPMDLVAMQTEMIRFDMQGAAMYWQQVASAILEMERELLGSTASAAQSEADQMSSGLAGQVPMPGLNPFFFNVNGGVRPAA